MKHYEVLKELSELPLEESTLVLMNKRLNNTIYLRRKHNLTEDQQLLTDVDRKLICDTKELMRGK